MPESCLLFKIICKDPSGRLACRVRQFRRFGSRSYGEGDQSPDHLVREARDQPIRSSALGVTRGMPGETEWFGCSETQARLQ